MLSIISDALPPKKQPLISTEEEGGWAPKSVWAVWRRENILSLLEFEDKKTKYSCTW